MKFLSNVLETLSTLDLHAKKGKFRTILQNILFTGQFMICFITARGKSKIVCKEFVSSFSPVNLREGQFFVTAEETSLKSL